MDPKTRTEALEWGPRQLSGEKVAVELGAKAVEDAWDSAKRWWVSLRGVERRAVAVGGSGVYAMPDDCETVLEVFFTGDTLGITYFDPYAMLGTEYVPQSSLSVPWSMFQSTLAMYAMRSEMNQRILGLEPSWDWDQDNRQLLIYPTTQTGGILARYISNTFTDSDPTPPATTPRNDLRRITLRERDILLRYFVADLKAMLGRVRGKYVGGLPSAGGLAQLDGDLLRNEAAEEKTALKDELINLGDSPMCLVG